MARKSKAHPGFKAVAHKIASQYGGDEERGERILAARSREASASAKRKNPRLLKVRGKA